MPRKPKEIKRPVGRPTLPIDWEKVEQYMMAGCNGTQIAASLGISADTLYDRCESDNGVNYSAYLQEKRAKGDSLIHAKQFSKGVKEGNVTMLIWLGKQRLGQVETPTEIHVSEETMSQFNELMAQLSSLQSSRKMLDIKNKNESKS